MDKLAKLKKEDFDKCKDKPFKVRTEELDEDFSLRVDKVEAMRGESFSVVFAGPQEPVLQQSIIPLSHADLGELDIFLVPVGQEDGTTYYEAVFTRN
ncbi:MAG TPA: hypothetical protein VLU25_19340 [Acidobacteriota bacterium]|nr:hypothetical protein [Acidobacteriota bacterium]